MFCLDDVLMFAAGGKKTNHLFRESHLGKTQHGANMDIVFE